MPATSPLTVKVTTTTKYDGPSSTITPGEVSIEVTRYNSASGNTSRVVLSVEDAYFLISELGMRLMQLKHDPSAETVLEDVIDKAIAEGRTPLEPLDYDNYDK